jgi:uncharacterized phage protein gp47/JayE
MATTTLPRIDYASTTFSTFLENLQSFLSAELPEDVFNDLVASQLMMFMLRMNAYISDVQSFKLDIVANENFLPTALQRRSVIRFAKAVGYRLSAATASSVTVTTVLTTPNASPITIRKGTLFDAEGITFEIDQDYVLPALATTINMGALQGETFVDNFTSVGVADQKFQATKFPVIQNSMQIHVDTVLWDEIDFFAFAGALDQVYTLSFDENNKATSQFGNDVFGAIPPPGADLQFTYRVGGGSDGNVTTGAVNTNIPAFINNLTLTSIPITNNSPASGGSDEESIEHAKLFIPRDLKTINHAVTDQDYDTIAAGFSDPSAGTVAKANATLRGGELNKIDVFIWTRDTTGVLVGASLALRNALKAELATKNVISHDIAVFSGITEPVDITASVVYPASKTEAEVTAEITTALQDFFNSDTLDPGDSISLSSLYDLLHNLDSVRSVIISVPSTDFTVVEARIAVLGTVTLTLTAAELSA